MSTQSTSTPSSQNDTVFRADEGGYRQSNPPAYYGPQQQQQQQPQQHHPNIYEQQFSSGGFPGGNGPGSGRHSSPSAPIAAATPPPHPTQPQPAAGQSTPGNQFEGWEEHDGILFPPGWKGGLFSVIASKFCVDWAKMC